MKKRAIIFLLVALIIFCGVSFGAKALTAAQKTSDKDVAAKLEQVIQNQSLILETLAKIQEELRIIKIRATGRRGN